MPAPLIKDRDKFIIETSQLAMHALILHASGLNIGPDGIAEQARKHAIELWRKMRAPIDDKE